MTKCTKRSDQREQLSLDYVMSQANLRFMTSDDLQPYITLHEYLRDTPVYSELIKLSIAIGNYNPERGLDILKNVGRDHNGAPIGHSQEKKRDLAHDKSVISAELSNLLTGFKGKTDRKITFQNLLDRKGADYFFDYLAHVGNAHKFLHSYN